MQQKPVIYVSRITNLSDARYCAGMGVDMLGFIIDPNHPDYVSPQRFQEMMGWISGPKRVVEFSIMETLNLDDVLAYYKPDLLHVPGSTVMNHDYMNLPLVVDVAFENLLTFQSTLGGKSINLHTIVITHLPGAEMPTSLLKSNGEYEVLLSLEKVTSPLKEILEKSGANGFALQGSREDVPGLKDYDHLSRILEELEV